MYPEAPGPACRPHRPGVLRRKGSKSGIRASWALVSPRPCLSTQPSPIWNKGSSLQKLQKSEP